MQGRRTDRPRNLHRSGQRSIRAGRLQGHVVHDPQARVAGGVAPQVEQLDGRPSEADRRGCQLRSTMNLSLKWLIN